MTKFKFVILKEQCKTKARLGEIITPRGIVETPAFIPVATQGSVKSLSPEEILETQTQIILCNTYHLYLSVGDIEIKKLGGLHKFMNWKKPIITDSGGFQVFSLGLSNKKINFGKEKLMTQLNNEGVIFQSHIDGSFHKFTPEKSIKIQENLGSDIIIAFDHCPPYPTSYEYADQALERTFLWAKRCKLTHKNKKQALYGVIQGSVYQDLRIKSAKQIISLDFDGYAIGGVAVGEKKEEMVQTVQWVSQILPKDKPIHLLGVGDIDDLINCVEWGIDTFDCVSPTRLGRMGHFFTLEKKFFVNKKYQANISKSYFKTQNKPLMKKCLCYACRNFTQAYLHHLFKTEELLAYRLLTIHNLHFIQHLMQEIREAIYYDKIDLLKKKWLF